MKHYETNQKRDIVRKRNEKNRELLQHERIQNRENVVEEEDNILGRFLQIATGDQIYVNSLNLHEIENEILEEYIGDFEMMESKVDW